MPTYPLEVLDVILKRCPPLAVQSLEAFLGGLLEIEPAQLAQLPGTPGQVLAAQFTCYARSAVLLEEEVRHRSEAFSFLADILRRLPEAQTNTRRRKTRGHPSRAQAAGG